MWRPPSPARKKPHAANTRLWGEGGGCYSSFFVHNTAIYFDYLRQEFSQFSSGSDGDGVEEESELEELYRHAEVGG